MAKIIKKAGLLALILLMILTCFNLINIGKSPASAAGVAWIGAKENLSESGREGILFKAENPGWANAYTRDTYNMNEGITIRFRVNSIPGLQGEVDAWFAIMLQASVETTPLGSSEGFKFLFREADPKTATGMAIQRMIAIPNGSGPIYKTPLLSPVPMLGNDHYISIVQRRNGNGFLISIDGVVTDYYADDDAFMIEDLTEAHVIAIANLPQDAAAPWEVEIDKIQPLTQTAAWEAFGAATVVQNEQNTVVVESTAKSGANSAIFYKSPVSVEKWQEIELTLNQCPAYTDEFSDAYVAVILSKEEYATNINATDALIAVFKLKDRDTLMGNFGQGSMAAGFDKPIDAVSPHDELSVAFGFDENGLATIVLNGEIVGTTKNIKANNFLDKQGYISIVTYNDSSSKSNWAFTVSSLTEKEGNVVGSAPKQAQTQNSGDKVGGIVLLCVGGVCALAAIGLLGGMFVMKKKNGERKQ